MPNNITQINRRPSVDAAWRSLLHALKFDGLSVSGVTDPMSVGSNFGVEPRAFRELIGITVAIENVRDRLIQSAARPIAPAFLLANVLWTASGSDSVDEISYFNQRGRLFSDDGRTLAGPPGKRMFDDSLGNQFEQCRRLIASDSTSRRAVIALYLPTDTGSHHRDCPCILHMQFLLRDDRLCCVVGVRSQSVAMVFPYDAFLVTMIQESLAVSLDVDVGDLVLHFGSLHYYEDEQHVVDAILAEDSPSTTAMPRMTDPIPFVQCQGLASLTNCKSQCTTHRLSSYWTDYLEAIKHGLEFQQARGVHSIPLELRSSWFASLFQYMNH